MGLVNLLGRQIVLGGLCTVLAGIAFLSWEYLRLGPGGRWLSYAVTTRRVAIVLFLISALLMICRFVYVVSVNGGV